MKTAEQHAFAEAVDDFCRAHAGTREQRDALSEHGQHPHNPGLYAACARLGWLGAGLPEAYGGAGGGMTETAIFAERIAYGLAPLGGFVTSMVAVGPYLRFGTEQQRKSVVTGAANGAVEAISISEPGAGSDAAAIRCRAEAVDGGYVINGQKTWCSNAHLADHILLVARTSTHGDRHAGLTMFCVPAGVAGLTVRGIPTMGGREVNDLFLTNCFLPADAVVGAVDRAWPQLMAGLNSERLILAATMLGRARRAFDDTVAYVRERTQFGQPIGSFQALRHRLADLATELACADLLVYDVAARVDADPETQLPREASMAKLKATETAKKVAIEGMQMMGGYGYTTEFDMESHLRATIVSTVYGGTSEIQRDIIGRSYGL
ncbi:acyl-CoA/acyl-ACP dehydrogenase [Frankia sp. CNm7]|uniref:Acyl-CoA/acyl-ACP dehydrogenase n=1 Tax=Frankia nepalensis TaxID=1836974 RepID=A0A937RGX3_9ACTN|nr:acyl-CoA dehydrogenase family protein [Frankia nepalensis]MBL7499261.1 acyl-CoA/acyl-ACP dehydrogenase [Frankia nepalensis]MBL7513490.1 acyl-CoA/acyl-ACP dehydrogenase [Frankia nepalensis]MBL7521846.1 acyl-CoA/acyl-ACP dehydrogenase [Frankia nepalensis]MBL7628765.1 acyl-CoA/acyl-ACP dehydrogenase [Frankia nepalensis]